MAGETYNTTDGLVRQHYLNLDGSTGYTGGPIRNTATSQVNPAKSNITFGGKTGGSVVTDPATGKLTYTPNLGMMDYIGTGAQVFNAAAAGMNAYTGYKALGLAKDEFAFKKNATNRDIANQGKLINNNIINSNNVGLALAGNTLTPEQQAASRAAAQSRQVNTSAIG